jgi:hypothetical protein
MWLASVEGLCPAVSEGHQQQPDPLPNPCRLPLVAGCMAGMVLARALSVSGQIPPVKRCRGSCTSCMALLCGRCACTRAIGWTVVQWLYRECL